MLQETTIANKNYFIVACAEFGYQSKSGQFMRDEKQT